MNPIFWRGKKVFLTGHTGFKGSWMSLWLQSLGADVTGYSLEPPTKPSLFDEANVYTGMTSIIGDIRDRKNLSDAFAEAQPEIVFHMAAQPLVRASYREPIETFETNVMGTLHVCEAMRSAGSVRAAVIITTDKCYENRELDKPFTEDQPLGGRDPYSASKGCTEIAAASWRESFLSSDLDTALATARAGNVIGGGDWAEDRLLPDIFRALGKGEAVRIRSPHSIRPWQHVLEPLSGYLSLAERLYVHGKEYAEGWNFGPDLDDAQPVEEVVRQMCSIWGDNATWVVDHGEHPHEAQFLKLDITKAKTKLDWHPVWRLPEALRQSTIWQKAWIQGHDMRKLCLEQIHQHEQEAR